MTSSKKRTTGIILMVAPIPVLIVILVFYPIFSIILSLILSASDPDILAVFLFIIHLTLGIIVIISIIGIVIGMPLGLYLLIANRPGKNRADQSL